MSIIHTVLRPIQSIFGFLGRLSLKIKLVLTALLVLAGAAFVAFAFILPGTPPASNHVIFLYSSENGYSETQYGFEPVRYPTVLYDNGLFVCGSSHVGEGTPKQRYLDKKTQQTFFEELGASGFLGLKSGDYSEDSEFPQPLDLETTIYANKDDQPIHVTYSSPVSPKKLSKTTAYIQTFCNKEIRDDFHTGTYLVRAIKLDDAKQAGQEYRTVQVDQATADMFVRTNVIEPQQSKTVDQKSYEEFQSTFKADTAILAYEDKLFLVNITPALHPYELAGGNIAHARSADVAGDSTNKQVLADATPHVEFIWLHGSNQAPPSDATTILRRTSQRVRDWYMSKAGKTLKFGGNRVLKSSQTIGQIETCPSETDCQGDKSLAAYYNLKKSVYPDLTGRQVVVLYQGTHDQCNGWGAPNSGDYGGGSLNSAGTSNGGFGLLNIIACNWDNGREKVAGHELGHALGSTHWCQDKNIMVGSGCSSSARSDGLRYANMNDTQKNAFLGSEFFKKSSDRLLPGQRLYSGGVMHSIDGSYRLIVQPTDGNVVVYRNDNAYKWDSTTYNPGNPHIIFEFAEDGNVHASTDYSYGCRSGPRPGANRLIMQHDGNLVAYDAANQAKWATSWNYWYC